MTSQDGTAFTTDPTLAKYIRATGTFTASAVNTAGDYLSKGIVQAGEWYRCGAAPVAFRPAAMFKYTTCMSQLTFSPFPA